MISNQEKSIEYIANIFSLSIEAKINFEVITDVISRSEFIQKIEKEDFSLINRKTPYEIFVDMFNKKYIQDNCYMKYDAAYWCGYAYANIFYKYKKPFSYIFIKLPLSTLINMYDIYHEMDVSQLYEQFEIEEKRNTILRLLLKKHMLSGAELARRTGISIGTINKLKKDDSNLYNASYATAQRIAFLLDEPGDMFLKRI